MCVFFYKGFGSISLRFCGLYGVGLLLVIFVGVVSKFLEIV